MPLLSPMRVRAIPATVDPSESAPPVLLPVSRERNPVLDLLYPPRCAACDGAGTSGAPDPLCAGCWSGFPWIDRDCLRCGRAMPPGARREACPDCRGRRLGFDRAVGVAVHRGAARAWIHRYKYRGWIWLDRSIAERIARRIVREVWACRLVAVTAVPSHWRKRLRRGMHPAEGIGREVARTLGLPFDPRMLRRIRHDRPQVSLGRRERLANPEGAFAARARRVPGRGGVLVVDDVMTTGATMDACGVALLRVGAGEVYGAAFARSSD